MNQKEMFIITLTIFLTIVAWMIADLYHIANTRQVYVPNEKFARQYTVTVDQELFSILQEKQ